MLTGSNCKRLKPRAAITWHTSSATTLLLSPNEPLPHRLTSVNWSGFLAPIYHLALNSPMNWLLNLAENIFVPIRQFARYWLRIDAMPVIRQVMEETKEISALFHLIIIDSRVFDVVSPHHRLREGIILTSKICKGKYHQPGYARTHWTADPSALSRSYYWVWELE